MKFNDFPNASSTTQKCVFRLQHVRDWEDMLNSARHQYKCVSGLPCSCCSSDTRHNASHHHRRYKLFSDESIIVDRCTINRQIYRFRDFYFWRNDYRVVRFFIISRKMRVSKFFFYLLQFFHVLMSSDKLYVEISWRWYFPLR